MSVHKYLLEQLPEKLGNKSAWRKAAKTKKSRKQGAIRLSRLVKYSRAW